MYCKRCRYDLRGQVETRCPECGRAYCPGDPNTYLSENRHALLIVARQVRKAATFPPTLLTLGFIILMSGPLFLLPQLSSGPSLSLRVISQRNLKSIVTAWMIQRFDHPSNGPFEFTQVKNQLLPRLSAWTDQPILHARFGRAQTFRRHAWWIYALFIYTALMIPICHLHLRRWRAIPCRTRAHVGRRMIPRRSPVISLEHRPNIVHGFARSLRSCTIRYVPYFVAGLC